LTGQARSGKLPRWVPDGPGRLKFLSPRCLKFLSPFDARFREILRAAGLEVLLTAFQAPNMNVVCERFVRSVKSECLSKLIFVGESMLRRALREFVEHYHGERPHQGRGNDIIQPAREPMASDGRVFRSERLGGLLSYYYRRAG